MTRSVDSGYRNVLSYLGVLGEKAIEPLVPRYSCWPEVCRALEMKGNKDIN